MVMSSYNRKLKKSWLALKAVSGVLVSVLLIQDVAFAAGTPVLEAPVEISRDLGSIRDRASFPSKKIIINIQDSHGSLTAQESISKILDDLVKKYDLKLISLEGATNTVDTSLVSSFPIAEVRKKTGQAMLKQGQISAGEFYSMISEKPVMLFGADDKKLYTKDLQVFKNLIEHKKEIRRELKPLHGIVLSLEKKIYSEELRNFLVAKRQYHSTPAEFGKYWAMCRTIAKKFAIPYIQYKNLQKLDQLLSVEAAINFKAAAKERETLINQLSKSLAKKSLEELILAGLEYKKNQNNGINFHKELLKKAKQQSLPLSNYPNLVFYTQYLESFYQIDLLGLISDLGQFENIIRRRLETTEQSRILSKLSKRVRLFSSILDTAVDSEDYGHYIKLSNHTSTLPIQNSIQQLCKLYNLKPLVQVRYEVLEKVLPDALLFYDYAAKRNQALLDNTLKKMEKEHVHIAALITGGFHSEGVAKLLNEEKISHLVVMPKFETKNGARPYVTILTKKPKEYDLLFQNSEIYLAPPSMFEMPASPALTTATPNISNFQQQKEILLRMLAQAHLSGELSRKNKGRFLKSYWEASEDLLKKTSEHFSVTPKYMAAALRSLKIERTPDGLQMRLYNRGFAVRSYESYLAKMNGDEVESITRLADGTEKQWGYFPEAAAVSVFALKAAFGIAVPGVLAAGLFAMVMIRFVFGGTLSFNLAQMNCGLALVMSDRRPEDGKGVYPKRIENDLTALIEANLNNGGQSAGIAALAQDSKGEFKYKVEKAVGGKRGKLVPKINKNFKKVVLSDRDAHGTPIMTAKAHSRYATQGKTSKKEAQPHMVQFINRFFVGGTNGDLNSFKMWANQAPVNNTSLRFWFDRVDGAIESSDITYRKNNKGQLTPIDTEGDNELVVRLLSFFTTKGLWDASLKAAYQLTVAESVKDAAGGKELYTLVPDPNNPLQVTAVPTKHPNTAPSLKTLAQWAALMEKSVKAVENKQPKNLEQALVQEILRQNIVDQMAKSDPKLSRLSAAKREIFVRTMVYFFFHQSPIEAAKFHLSRMDGTTALHFNSTLDPYHAIAAAKGQPMFIGTCSVKNSPNPNKPFRTLYANSEPQEILNRIFAQGEDLEKADLYQLNDIDGEIAHLGLEGIQIYSMKTNRLLTPEELKNRANPVLNNPYFKKSPRQNSKDANLDDMNDIPKVKKEIVEDLANADTKHSPTRNALGKLLIGLAKLRAKEQKIMSDNGIDPNKKSTTIDVLVLGEEISAAVGEDFATSGFGSLQKMFPMLNVVATTSNDFQLFPDKYPVGKDTVILSISQSGKTSGTKHATVYLDEKTKVERNEHEENEDAGNFYHLQDFLGEKGVDQKNVFIMTGEYVSLMGFAIGQGYKPDSPHTNRIFTNGSGSRPAEASTVAIDAAPTTLTQILYYLAVQMREAFPDPNSRPLGMKLTKRDLKAWADLEKTHSKMAEKILGRNADGEKIKTEQHQKLLRLGYEKARLLTEWYDAMKFIVFPLVFLAMQFGFSAPIALYFGLHLSFAWLVPANIAAAGLFTVLSYPATYLWRFLIGNWNKDRVSGGKTIVIADYSQLRIPLAMFIRKRFALSYSFNTVYAVHEGTPDQVLHYHAADIRRGTWIEAGMQSASPFSELLQRATEATATAIAHTIGIQNWNTPPRILTRTVKPFFQRNTSVISLLTAEEAKDVEDAQKEILKTDHPELVEEMMEARTYAESRFLSGLVVAHEMSRIASSKWIFGWNAGITHFRARTQSTVSAVPPLKKPVKSLNVTPFPKQPRKLHIVDDLKDGEKTTKEAQGARLAINKITPTSIILALLTVIMAPVQAMAATVTAVSGKVITFIPDRGEGVWHVARKILGDTASSKDVNTLKDLIVSQNPQVLADPNHWLFLSNHYSIETATPQLALDMAQKLGYTAATQTPVPQAAAAPTQAATALPDVAQTQLTSAAPSAQPDITESFNSTPQPLQAPDVSTDAPQTPDVPTPPTSSGSSFSDAMNTVSESISDIGTSFTKFLNETITSLPSFSNPLPNNVDVFSALLVVGSSIALLYASYKVGLAVYHTFRSRTQNPSEPTDTDPTPDPNEPETQPDFAQYDDDMDDQGADIQRLNALLNGEIPTDQPTVTETQTATVVEAEAAVTTNTPAETRTKPSVVENKNDTLVDLDDATYPQADITRLDAILNGTHHENVVETEAVIANKNDARRNAELTLQVGIILPPDQNPEEFEKYLMTALGNNMNRFHFIFATRITNDLMSEWRSQGVSLILDEPSTENPDLRFNLLQFLAKADEKIFNATFPFIAALTKPNLDQLSLSEQQNILRTIEAVLPKPQAQEINLQDVHVTTTSQYTFGVGEAQNLAKSLDRTLTTLADFPNDKQLAIATNTLNKLVELQAELFAADQDANPAQAAFFEALTGADSLRFAFADPSNHQRLADLANPGESARNIFTDLEAFAKDADGAAYARGVERLAKKAPGAFTDWLLVRDPLLTNNSDVLRKYPEAKIYRDRMVFAPGVKSVQELQTQFPNYFNSDSDSIVIMPKPEQMAPLADTDPNKPSVYVFSLDVHAENTIGAHDTAARVLANPAIRMKNLIRRSDGSYIYAPPITPQDYKELLEAIHNAHATAYAA